MVDPTIVRIKARAQQRVAADFVFTEKDVLAISESLQEPSWMRDRRIAAWKQAKSLPMPTTAEEAWRRTDIRHIPANEVALGKANGKRVSRSFTKPLVANSHGALMVQQPGHPPIFEADPSLTRQGVIFVDWLTAIKEQPSLLRDHLGQIVAEDEDKFSAVSAALATQGFILYVPEGIQIELPIHSVLWAPGQHKAFFSRLLVLMGNGSSLTYVHESASPTSTREQDIHAGIVELHIGEAASLTFIELQSWGQHVWHFTHERARVERDGKLNWVFGAVGSHLTKSFSDLDLVGEGAEARMSGFYFSNGNQHFDFDTQQNHLAPHTTSDLLYKGALLDRSRSVWQGMIYVAPGAQKTDGYQANRNLILSESARADSLPGLEILADDVRCTHAATVGQLEEDAIYYLMTRGLPRDHAERLVVNGFFSQVLERIPFEGVRKRFLGMIDEKMK
jgi:Fe-S cluster assembly protein SufD